MGGRPMYAPSSPRKLMKNLKLPQAELIDVSVDFSQLLACGDDGVEAVVNEALGSRPIRGIG